MVPKVFITCNPSRNPISQHFTSPLYQFETHPSDSNIYFLPLSNEPIKSVNSCLCSCCLPSFSLFNFSLKRCLFVIVPYAQMFQNVLLPTSTGSHLFCANSQGLLFLSLGYYKLKPPSLLPNIIFKLNRFLLTLYFSYSSYCIEVLHLKFPFLVLTFLHNHFYVIWLLNCYQVYAIQLNSTLIPAFEKNPALPRICVQCQINTHLIKTESHPNIYNKLLCQDHKARYNVIFLAPTISLSFLQFHYNGLRLVKNIKYHPQSQNPHSSVAQVPGHAKGKNKVTNFLLQELEDN